MKIIGFNNKEYQLKVKRRKVDTSKLHVRARAIIKDFFPMNTFYEEVTLPGSRTHKNDTLYADFLSIQLKIIVEVHGQQHYEYNSHFHKSQAAFRSSNRRDQLKLEWAELNGFQVIEFPYNETDDEWTQRLKQSISM